MSTFHAVGVALAAAVFAAPAAPLVPDSWMPFADKRVVSHSGQRYVVVEKQGRGIRWKLCESAEGAGPVAAAERSSLRRGGAKAPDISPRAGDRVVHEGKYAQLPLEVVVADELDGFLLFEQYGGVGYAKSLVWIESDGDVRFEHTLADLFDGDTPRGAMATTSSLWWNRGYWLDEKNGVVVLVTTAGELREVRVADGAVSDLQDGRLLDGAMFGSVSGRSLAMELIAEGPAAGCEKALSLVAGVFHDQEQPMALRLRAGWILVRAGAPAGVRELFEANARANDDDAVRRFAVRRLPDVLGADAMPLLRELMRGKASTVWGEAYQAFASIGDAAIPTLREMLAEVDESPDYRGGAAHALGRIGSRAALEAVTPALDDANDYVAGAARGALRTGVQAVVERAFAALPAEGAIPDEAIAAITEDLRVVPLTERRRALENLQVATSDERQRNLIERLLQQLENGG